MIYLTYNDAPSGIYSGQVIDVCRFISEELSIPVRLVAFVSIRSYFRDRSAIRSQYSRATVLPMFPKTRNWRKNGFLLGLVRFFSGEKTIMARGPFATALALRLRDRGKISKVIFDGRGAYLAELTEYNVVPDETVKREIEALEKDVVLRSDKRLAVSEALVGYWRKQFAYAGDAHRVIPCTLNRNTVFVAADAPAVAAEKAKMGFASSDIVVVYSGSSAGWQSLEQFGKAMLPVMEAQPEVKLLLLVQSLPEKFEPAKRFPGRVQQAWKKASEVGTLLAACTYGWLVREASVTNQVASPVKFAEYLAAGLHVLISPGLGDYTPFVEQQKAGYVTGEKLPRLEAVTAGEKQRLQELARTIFVKAYYTEHYRFLLA